MPEVRVEETLSVHYEDHYFGEPWLDPEVVLMVHGAAESSQAWYAWVSHLARQYRLIRVDLRGSGASSPAPPSLNGPCSLWPKTWTASWTPCKSAPCTWSQPSWRGRVAALRRAFPKRVLSLAVLGAGRQEGSASGRGRVWRICPRDARAWAANSQRSRLGSGASQAQVEWWTDFMGHADAAGFAGLGQIMGSLENFWDLHRITAPTLVIRTEGSALGDAEAMEEWSRQIPNSELVILPGDSYHIAAAEPDRCAEMVLQFIKRHPK
jgi:pimeloyl-ACP methyl ester carboxylesterase